jgi:hypothetical protein
MRPEIGNHVQIHPMTHLTREQLTRSTSTLVNSVLPPDADSDPRTTTRIFKVIKTTAVRKPEEGWFLWNNGGYIENKTKIQQLSQEMKEKWALAAWG